MSVGNETILVEKYHGTGNDFLIVNTRASDVPDRAAFAVAHCDRETGIDPGSRGKRRGADGVLFLAIEECHDPTQVRMELVQPDGSSAEMCGNGLRCVARWASHRTDETTFVVDTPVGPRRTTVEDDRVTVEMGRPSFDPTDVPLACDGALIEEHIEGLTVTAVNTGVPHAVSFVENIFITDLDAVAHPVRHADIFPEGTNVTLAAVDDDGFRQRTFERGVESETRACGTGAVAIVACAKRLGRSNGEKVHVSPPGGSLGVTVLDDGPTLLSGPAMRSYGTTVKVSPK